MKMILFLIFTIFGSINSYASDENTVVSYLSNENLVDDRSVNIKGQSYDDRSVNNLIRKPSNGFDKQENISSKSISNKTIDKVIKSKTIQLNGKSFILIVNDDLVNNLSKQSLREQLLTIINKLNIKKHHPKVVGYTFLLGNETINVSPFLGENAK